MASSWKNLSRSQTHVDLLSQPKSAPPRLSKLKAARAFVWKKAAAITHVPRRG